MGMKWFTLAFLWGMQLLDLVSTNMGLALGASEANPIMAPFVDTYLPAAMKLVVIPLIIAYCIHKTVWAAWTAGICALLYVGVVLNNLLVIGEYI